MNTTHSKVFIVPIEIIIEVTQQLLQCKLRIELSDTDDNQGTLTVIAYYDPTSATEKMCFPGVNYIIDCFSDYCLEAENKDYHHLKKAA